MRTTLTTEQRDRLWHEGQYELQADLAGFTMTRAACAASREELLAAAERVGDFIALYDDIGWERVDEREVYTLSMPDDQLRRIGERFQEVARDLLRDDTAGVYESLRENTDQDLELLQTSRLILGEAS